MKEITSKRQRILMTEPKFERIVRHRDVALRAAVITEALIFASRGDIVTVVCPEHTVQIFYDILNNWLKHYEGFTTSDEYYTATHTSGGSIKIVAPASTLEG